MSHYATLVLVEPDLADEAAVEARIAELLEPFNENTEVASYDRPCYCVDAIAQRAGSDAAELAWPIDTLRHELHREFPGDDFFGDAAHARWNEVLAPRRELEEAVRSAHPDHGKPDPTCEECGGSGLQKSTYNPQSKWDWWVIGGRWYGELTGIKRESENGFNFSIVGEMRAAGKLIDENSGIVGELDPEAVARCGFSLVTPDGAWHAKAEMGWFGMTFNETSDWPARLRQVLSEFPRYRAVLCDLHI